MINKNNKRLLSAFIAAMIMCPVASGSEINYLTIVRGFKKKGNAYVRELAGEALDKLRAKYEPINNDKIFAGHAGVVSQYRCIEPGENCGRIVAVKCIPDPVKTGMETAHTQYDSIADEIAFFNKIKEYKEHPGIVNCYDIFYDDKVTYIVQDWIEGTTLSELYKKLENKKGKLSNQKLLKFSLKFLHKIYKVCDFTSGQLKIVHRDLHHNNIILVPKHPNGETICDKFEDFDIYLIDWGEYDKIEENERKDVKSSCFTFKNQILLSMIRTQVRSVVNFGCLFYPSERDQIFDLLDRNIFNYHGPWGRNNLWPTGYKIGFDTNVKEKLAQSFDELSKHCEEIITKLNNGTLILEDTKIK